MESRPAPIGFEGIFTDQTGSYIGFEQYEDEQQRSTTLVYPLDDTMPIPSHSPRNNFFHFDHPSSISERPSSPSAHSSSHDINSYKSTKKILSYPLLFSIYNEIVNQWSKTQWLTFADQHTKTYLTLDSNTNEFVSIQMALNQHSRTHMATSLLSLPECLLIRTKSKTQAFFLPNSIISIENLCVENLTQHSFQYKLMAIVCHSDETNSKIMFYKDFQSDHWYSYYDQSISAHSHANILSTEEQTQLELFIQPKDQFKHIDPSKFTYPLTALFTHPIIYVYIPEKKN